MFRTIQITRFFFVVFSLLVVGCACPPTVAPHSVLFVVRDKITGEFINDATLSVVGPLGVQDTGYPPDAYRPHALGRGEYDFGGGLWGGRFQVTFTHSRYRTHEATFVVGVIDNGTCNGTYPTYNIQLDPL